MVERAAALKSLKIGGRLMLDAAMYDRDDVDLSSGAEVRRGWLYVKGEIDDEWSFKGQFEFRGSASAEKNGGEVDVDIVQVRAQIDF